jgi:hypothetical protein
MLSEHECAQVCVCPSKTCIYPPVQKEIIFANMKNFWKCLLPVNCNNLSQDPYHLEKYVIKWIQKQVSSTCVRHNFMKENKSVQKEGTSEVHAIQYE